MQYLKATDWVEFRQKFPDADAWMRSKNLKRELLALRNEVESTLDKRRAVWCEHRIAELESIPYIDMDLD